MSLPAQHHPGILEAGLDEAGRGCLAGPVVAAAVILPPDFQHPWLTDSKQLKAGQRDTLRALIETEALAWAVAEVSHTRIDEINILNASFEAMHIAVSRLQVRPEFLLIDGNRFRQYAEFPVYPYACMVKGDGRCLHPRQDPPRPGHGGPARRPPPLRLGPEQGLSHGAAPRGRRRAWSFALAPRDLSPSSSTHTLLNHA